MKILKFIALIFVFQQSLNAQNFFGLFNDGNHIVSMGINANPNLNIHADYIFAFDINNPTIQRWGIITHLNFPLFSQKGFDFDLRIGAGTIIGIVNQFKVLTGLTWNFSRTVTLNGTYFHSGFKLDVFPGYYAKRWALALHVALNYQPILHVKHSDYARDAFNDLYPLGNGLYNAPKDGWFYQNNLTLQSGIALAYFRPKWHVNLTAGFQYQSNRLGLIALPDIGILPFYGGLNIGYAIK